MARKSIEQRLAELDAQRSALKARLSKQDRANDTRRKVLLGALVLHRLENANDPEFTKRLGDWLRRELPGFLTRDNDKALFDDLLKPETASTTEVETSAGGAAE
ncbi:mobilization protein [Rhizobium ruizarguesonis]